jgi:hypothetical protein
VQSILKYSFGTACARHFCPKERSSRIKVLARSIGFLALLLDKRRWQVKVPVASLLDLAFRRVYYMWRYGTIASEGTQPSAIVAQKRSSSDISNRIPCQLNRCKPNYHSL